MKFSIRDLLWLTVVVALVLAWWMDRTRIIQHYETLFSRKVPIFSREMPNSKAPAPNPPNP